MRRKKSYTNTVIACTVIIILAVTVFVLDHRLKEAQADRDDAVAAWAIQNDVLHHLRSAFAPPLSEPANPVHRPRRAASDTVRPEPLGSNVTFPLGWQ